MISQIFVSPDSLENNNNYASINSLLNDIIDHPIFVIDFKDVNWVNFINKTYLETGYSRSDRDTLIRKLNHIAKTKKIFKRDNHKIEILSNAQWLEVVELSNANNPFDLFVSGQTCISNYQAQFAKKVENINNILVSPQQWKQIKFPDSEVKKTPADYERVFGEILKNSIQIKIVDAYIGKNFDLKRRILNSKDQDVIELFSGLLATNRTGHGIFEIHTILDDELNLNGDNYEMTIKKRKEMIQERYESKKLSEKRDAWNNIIQSLHIRFGHKYKVFFWSNRQYNDTLHDRYIFTDILAVAPGHSIAASLDTGQKTLWKVLNKLEREKQESKYEEDPYFIPSCDSIEVG